MGKKGTSHMLISIIMIQFIREDERGMKRYRERERGREGREDIEKRYMEKGVG